GNVFGLPLILGAAAEYGLNIVIRFMEGRDHGGPLIARSTMMAVLVSGLTTIVGFGSLMIADHRGIFGMGLLLTLGTATSLGAPPRPRQARLCFVDLDEVGVEGGAISEVGRAVARQNVDAVATRLEAVPPDSFDDDDARARRVGDLGGEARGASRALDANGVAVANIPRGGVGGSEHRRRCALTPAQ